MMTMKAIMKTEEKEGFELRELPVPKVGRKDVLIKVRAAAICGSDLKFYKWVPWCKKVIKSLPFIPGHECAGEVTAVGRDIQNIKVGDKVAAETHVPCGVCWQCRHHRPHTCENMELFGHTLNGGFAEFALIPGAAARRIPQEIPFDYGCLLEPMGIPFRAVERGDVKGESVVVIGCGPIGQFAIAFSKIFGAETIIGLDVNEKRLSIAKKMGATHLINVEKKGFLQEIKLLTKDSDGVGVVIDASGSARAMKEAFSYLRVGGRFVILGQTDGPLVLNPSMDIIFKEAQIIGLFGRKIWDTWEKTEKLLTSGAIDPNPLITHRFPLNEHEQAFLTALSGEGCKVLFIPDSQ